MFKKIDEWIMSWKGSAFIAAACVSGAFVSESNMEVFAWVMASIGFIFLSIKEYEE